MHIGPKLCVCLMWGDWYCRPPSSSSSCHCWCRKSQDVTDHQKTTSLKLLMNHEPKCISFFFFPPKHISAKIHKKSRYPVALLGRCPSSKLQWVKLCQTPTDGSPTLMAAAANPSRVLVLPRLCQNCSWPCSNPGGRHYHLAHFTDRKAEWRVACRVPTWWAGPSCSKPTLTYFS